MQFFALLPKRYVVLACILLLAGFLRFWNLNGVPPSVSLDEASIGWNAYAVSQTGKDEYGQFPLISQRGYDDYRRSTYLFLTIPFIGLLGLTDVAERLPAGILSMFTVFATFWIIQLFFAKQTKFSITVSCIATFLLAISPWHVYISRLGHESNACLSFLVFGMLFFLWGEKKKQLSLLITSFVFFALSMISYYSGQIVIPLLLVVLFILYRKTILPILFASKKSILLLMLVGILFAALLWNVFSPASLIRFQGTSTFTPSAHADLYTEMVVLRNNAVKHHNIVGSILYNRRWYPVVVFVEGYVSHFDPRWLFFNSGADSFKAPNMGLLYLWELPFILLGMIVVFCSKQLSTTSKLLIFTWFFLGPLPAAVATQAPHAMRSYNFLPTWQLFSACGLAYIFYKFKNIQPLSLVVFLVCIGYSLFTLYNNYFYAFPKQESSSYQYAMKDAMAYLIHHKGDYAHVVVSNQNNLYQSYMFYLFYSHYDPKTYQQHGGTISGGFAQTHSIDNITFRPINWNKEKPGTLIVGNPTDFPKGVPILLTSNYLNGNPGIVVVQK